VRVRLRDREWTPGELPFGELTDPDPRTVWSAIGTPMIDPDGVSDAAVSLTLNRALQRVVTRGATGLELIDSAIEEVERRYQRDWAILQALGGERRRTRPWTGLRPESMVQLRVLLTGGRLTACTRLLEHANQTAEPGAELRAMEALGSALLLGEAVPFFIPASIATALMTSDPPDDTLAGNIRLPFESVVVFFDAIPMGDLLLDGEVFDANGADVDPATAGLVGAVIHTGPDGVGLDPVVHWVVTFPAGDTHGVALGAGVWRASAQPGVIANLAALCTWGAWSPPPPAPRQLEGDEGSRPWRRALSRSAVRKAMARGAVIGVHVVDVAALGSAADQEATTGSSRTVRAHWRRGYWNSVRVATRDGDGHIIGDRLGIPDVDWHYEGRWIHPVLVQGTTSSVVTVYAVPERPTESS
jgi:hypothetical protein